MQEITLNNTNKKLIVINWKLQEYYYPSHGPNNAKITQKKKQHVTVWLVEHQYSYMRNCL